MCSRCENRQYTRSRLSSLYRAGRACSRHAVKRNAAYHIHTAVLAFSGARTQARTHTRDRGPVACGPVNMVMCALIIIHIRVWVFVWLTTGDCVSLANSIRYVWGRGRCGGVDLCIAL